MSNPTLLISVLFLIVFSIDCCQPNYQLQNIETGIANFQNTKSDEGSGSAITYRYSYFMQFVQTPQIALAINNLQSPNIELPSFYISIKGKNISEVEFLMVSYQSWSVISVNFIIALRNDLYLDSSQLDLTQSVNNTFLLQIKKTINPLKSIARVFLNGFLFMNPSVKEQRQSMMSIAIDVSQVLQRSIKVVLSGRWISSIKSLWFSYLIFEPQMAGFASYGGRMFRENFHGIQSNNLHQIIYRSPYKIFGLNGIQLNQKSLSLISSISSDFVATIYSSAPISSLTLDYIILGVPPNRMCLCEDSSLKYAFMERCLSACPSDTYAYQYRDGSLACLKCSAVLNTRLNGKRTGCECVEGYEFSVDGMRCAVMMHNGGMIIGDESRSISKGNNATVNNIPIDPPRTPTQTPPVVTPLPLIPTTIPLPTVQISNACVSQIANSYFDGTNCYCKPGFKNVSNSCIPVNELTLQQKLITPIPLILINNASVVEFTCLSQKQVFINGKCQCQIGFQKINNTCISKIPGVCNYGQYWNGQTCLCNTGFARNFNNVCVPEGSSQLNCSENQINNGLGYCICNVGFYNVTGKCISDKPCPFNSYRLSNGTCACNTGFITIQGGCSRCGQNKVWLEKQSRCVTYCGLNAFYNQTVSRCQCIPTFALSQNNLCQFCPPQKFILNNYCVSCQVNQYYNSLTKQCVCKQDFYMEKNGICVKKCPNNQFYDQASMSCKCQLTLGRFNGVCQVCPDNYFTSPITQLCLACSINQVFLDGACVCMSGFAPNQYGVCVPCGEVPNTFLVQGNCATCPGQKIYNGRGCVCTLGTTSVGLKCVRKCNNDQLMSDSGDCYKCPINQVIMDNQCACRANFQRMNGVCQLVCPVGSFLYQGGRCATCPQNKIYNPDVKGCVCQKGYYSNVYNQCQKLSIQLQENQCPVRKYFDSVFGCLDCSQYCVNCTNSTNCLKCDSNFLLINGRCWDQCGNGFIGVNEECDDQNLLDGDGCSKTCRVETNFKCSGVPSRCVSLVPLVRCGNGIIEIKEQCDDFNRANGDGCSSTCMIERLFTCYSQPSICTYNGTAHTCGNGFLQFSQQCDDGNFNLADGCDQKCMTEQGFTCISSPSVCTKIATAQMKLYTDIKYNINNIYISLQTDKKYKFESEAEMQNFIKMSYLNSTARPSTYCQQREDPELDVFDCLLLFSSGIPNRAFQAEFSYLTPVIGAQVKLVVNIDPLSGMIDKTRMMRRN